MYLLSSRFNMLAKTRQTWKLDGMNTLEYETISREYLPLYTNITVDIGTEEGLRPAAAPPPGKTAASEADVQMNSSARHKEGRWGPFAGCFPSQRCGVVAFGPISCACIHCGSTCLSRLETVMKLLPPWFLWYQWFILPWMRLEKLDSVSLYIYSAVVTGETLGCLRITILAFASASWTIHYLHDGFFAKVTYVFFFNAKCDGFQGVTLVRWGYLEDICFVLMPFLHEY